MTECSTLIECLSQSFAELFNDKLFVALLILVGAAALAKAIYDLAKK